MGMQEVFDLLLTVAPHAGAWIEIGLGRQLATYYTSHPTRVRGLKSSVTFEVADLVESHPTRVRGLKLNDSRQNSNRIGRTPRGCVD